MESGYILVLAFLGILVKSCGLIESLQVVLPEGCDEMVIDVYRMLESKGKARADPMARFNKLDDPNVRSSSRLSAIPVRAALFLTYAFLQPRHIPWQGLSECF